MQEAKTKIGLRRKHLVKFYLNDTEYEKLCKDSAMFNGTGANTCGCAEIFTTVARILKGRSSALRSRSLCSKRKQKQQKMTAVTDKIKYQIENLIFRNDQWAILTH